VADTTPETAASVLRRATTLLRTVQDYLDDTLRTLPKHITATQYDRAALMSQAVRPLLAAWLEAEAQRLNTTTHLDWQDTVAPHALAIAHALLAEEA
jgi:hypothetical protein